MKGSLLVTGTTSDAGKSVVVTGLCRALARRGVRVVPFKAQNMSNNSMVVAGPDGRGAEIGRAQWIQAIAAGVPPEVSINPILLKPGSGGRTHVVLNGQPAGTIPADPAQRRPLLAEAAFAAYDSLAARFDVVLSEGAGSPTEINLRAGDYVNLGLARHARMPVVVVGAIDRGGLYAALYGTVALLEPADQRLIAGFLVNKFRGDRGLLEPANIQISRLTGRPVLGVLPWTPHAWQDREDALELRESRATSDEPLRVAVVRLPHISNVTDLDALGLEPDVDVRFAARPHELADADLIVVPGTRSTIADLAWLRARGLDRVVAEHARAGRGVLGICGGCQMLGRTVADPHGVEAEPGTVVDGLGLLDIRTVFASEKVVRLATGTALGSPVSGYELHHGVVDGLDGALLQHGQVYGTMWHGALESDGFRSALLDEVAAAAGHTRTHGVVNVAQARAERLDLLAELVETHVDVEAITNLIAGGEPVGLPVLAAGPAPNPGP